MCANGLGLTPCVSVNPMMKFIYTPCKCKCKNNYIYVVLRGYVKTCKCKCKNKHVYMILHGYVKQCKCKTMYEFFKEVGIS